MTEKRGKEERKGLEKKKERKTGIQNLGRKKIYGTVSASIAAGKRRLDEKKKTMSQERVLWSTAPVHLLLNLNLNFINLYYIILHYIILH